MPDPNSTGAQLVAKHCAQCHALPLPTMHSSTDWPSVARRMWLREDGLASSLGVAAPSTSERYLMLEYLTGNALKVSGATLPAGPGRDAFQLVCSRCHALPDPKNHSPQDWPTVFKRMETNMARMKVPPRKLNRSLKGSLLKPKKDEPIKERFSALRSMELLLRLCPEQ